MTEPTDKSAPEGGMGLKDRARECARAIQQMALQPILFANQEYVTKWFEAVLRHEHTCEVQPHIPAPDVDLTDPLAATPDGLVSE